MITLQGGKCQLHLNRYCTHLVTGKASGIKYETATRHHIPIVTPDWITECCKKGTLVSVVEYHPRLLVSPNSSTAMITGFMDEDTDNNTAQKEQDRTKAMLEQLKQRMPWNQPSPPVSSSASHNLAATSTATVPYSTNGQNTANVQSQQHLPRSVSSTNLSTSTVTPAVSDQDVINQTNWLPQTSQTSQNNISQQIKTVPSQMQQQELSPQQQQMNMQHQLIQQQQLTPQQQLTQQQLTHQQQLQQPSYNQQQLLNQQQSPQIQQQQPIIPQQQQQSINSQLPQHQLNTQQQQLLTSQQKQLNQHQIIQQQQLQTQQPHLAQQQQQVQLTAQQQQQQIVMQQQQPLPSQQQIAGQHQLTQQQTPPQPLTPEQRQLILLQQQQQQQKIQQISQQLQQSAPQNSQQFVIKDGQLQQQPQNQQLIGPNQQGFIVQRDSQWQQQQYHLQLQRQQQQQQIGPQRPGGQWNQQPPQPPRQLIHLDAQTHQQLQQMDPQQRAQFIQRIQKQRNLILQRQMQNRQGQQGSHIAVIRSPGKPVQPGSLQWVQQARPQMMGPQLAQTPGQKPVHPGVQPPALTPINSSNQVIVSAGQPVQGPQVSQTAQPFQQGQLTPQQLAQLQLQKQQQMVRLQQLQHLQQQQQGAQQEPSLTSLPNNAQIPPDQQLVVNAKTKTALANMLTNRLQGGTAEGSAAGQLRLMTAQHRPPPPPSQDPQLLAAYQRRTLGNITNGASTGAPIKMQYAPVMPQPKAQFYGHNPNLKCTYFFFNFII